MDDLKEAVAEAERFLRRAEKVRSNEKWNKGIADYGTASAACKRASMDLSKALSRLRVCCR